MRRLVLPILLVIASVTAFRVSSDRGEQNLTAVSSGDVVSPITPLLSARRLPELLDAPRARAALEDDLAGIAARSPQLSCLVARDRDGNVLFEHNPEVRLVPASLQKLITAAAVLDQLGPQARLRTVVASTASVTDGVLDGDLFLIGGGDPLLHTADYVATFATPVPHTSVEQLADAVVAAGVTQINGSVVANENRYDTLRRPPAWDVEPDLARTGLTGPLSALMVNDGFESFPEQRESGEFPTPAADSALQAAATVDDLLEARGVVIAGGARVQSDLPADLVELAAIESLPMSEIVAEMLTYSDNTTAELLLKELGFVVSADGSTDAGALAALENLGLQGVDISTVLVEDGSGLSSRNRLSCRAVDDLLASAGLDSDLGRGLAISGVSGTLRDRYRQPPLADVVHAKTGSLATVTALAGYIETDNGQVVEFVSIINLEPAIVPELAQLQEDLLLGLVGYPSGPPLEALDPLDADREPAAPYVVAGE